MLFLNLLLEVKKLEKLKLILEKIIGIKKQAGKVRKQNCDKGDKFIKRLLIEESYKVIEVKYNLPVLVPRV